MKLTPIEREWLDKVLRAIAVAEAVPSEADFAQAPLLSDWKAAISPDGHVILSGKVTNRPRLGTTNLTTSQLITIDPEAGWARTASRWYRFGQSIDAFEVELAASLNGMNAVAAAIWFTLPEFSNIDDPDPRSCTGVRSPARDAAAPVISK